jgi:manganese efflux pump family protein
LFQFFMPVLGWFIGSNIVRIFSAVDHWIVLGLLGFIGYRMIRSGLNQKEDTFKGDPSSGWTLVFLSVATSIDAFAVGITLAMMHVSILYPSACIGIITATLSLIGLLIGHRLGERFGKRMEILGGVILIAIGLRVLVSHMIPS